MIVIKNKQCVECSGDYIKEKMIEKGFFLVDNTLFEVQNIPGFYCPECQLDMIKEDKNEMFYQLLNQGLYNPLEEKEIEVYLYAYDSDIEEGNSSCLFTNNNLNYGTHYYPVIRENIIYIVKNVPYGKSEKCFEGSLVEKAVVYNLRKLHKEVLDNEISSIEKIKYIVLRTQ